ncbi:dihydroxyacetone kinase subunit DhaK [Erwinia tracheiphila]|uniref:dihydroxyacetone kinase subunit DhaK n=1 Tax=Erwinia tracheiphila TaxID=65700 RepID=UPI001F318015|nr:dihydroxyacetone kinase subunit DhaK [Erwinia tracheiphila]UIA83347.1 dihydroxyacetone kinase subunit DhaK [Erwinia tracheiphila]UIA91903.1 dihydroxyacetone kinase subunit DhaK [Erwinia tracheiphila]
MLTTAVCGDIFASPGVDAILTAIINVSGDKGCLLIVKNYTGDSLNFGLAAEKARALGYSVEWVTVSDDIVLSDNPQPRGIAGTALVHKIVGYAAAEVKSLQEVANAARAVIEATSSIGVAFSSCHLPGDQQVKPGRSEPGMGIHGEPGVTTLGTQSSQQIVTLLSEKLQAHDKDREVVLLINNLGGFSSLEMGVLAREVLHSPLGHNVQQLISPATLVSDLDMKGFSLSILALSDYFKEMLCSPVEASGWQMPIALQFAQVTEGKKIPILPRGMPSENSSVANVVETIRRTSLVLEN